MRDASSVLTGKIYYEDAYQTSFDAHLLSVREERAEDGRRLFDVVPDRTCFFPEEGGQCPDRGTLAGFPVTDVQIMDGRIHHILSVPEDADPGALTEDAKVSGEIDWTFRFSNMQQHSGEHLFSGVVHRKYGFENVGFHLSEREVTLDFDGEVPVSDIFEIEREVNALITKNIASEIRITTPAEREGLFYRSKLDLPGEVRIVTFPGADACACCAPHVKRTGEIGLLKVTGMIRWKGGVRISIVCGDRALALFQSDHRIVTDTAAFLSTEPKQVFPLVQRMKEENRNLSAELKKAAAREMLQLAAALPADERDALLIVPPAEIAAMREAANALVKTHAGLCAIFAGDDATGYSFVIASSSYDCRTAAAHLKERFGARGGGKPDMVQGSVSASEADLRRAFESLLESAKT